MFNGQDHGRAEPSATPAVRGSAGSIFGVFHPAAVAKNGASLALAGTHSSSGLDLTGHGSNTAGMTTTEKIAVSPPKKLAARARRAVRRGDAASVSAYLSRALQQQAKLDDLRAMLDQMLAETGGPLTAAERRAADRALGIAPKATRKRTSR